MPEIKDAKKPEAGEEKKREKRTITEIRESKKTGEKMVYMSVPTTLPRNGQRKAASMSPFWATASR